MKEIQRSIFVLCLDKPVADGNEPIPRSLVAAQMLHGGGAPLNSANRWFDKTLQVFCAHFVLLAVHDWG